MATLFYVLSKIGFFVVQPSNLCLLTAVAGALLARTDRFCRLGHRLVATGLLALAIAGFSPLGNLLMLPLEQRFERIAPPPGSVEGIIILGGFEEARIGKVRHALAVNEAAERLTEAVSLARRYPAAKVVFTGGTGSVLMGAGDTAGSEIRDFLVDAGVTPERILLEEASRNTRENATFTKALVKPAPGSRWLLVTSAYHMPRSISIFRRAGFDVVAWPADYRTAGPEDALKVFDSIDNGLRRTDAAVKEYIGLVVYRAVGWSDALWPGP